MPHNHPEEARIAELQKEIAELRARIADCDFCAIEAERNQPTEEQIISWNEADDYRDEAPDAHLEAEYESRTEEPDLDWNDLD